MKIFVTGAAGFLGAHITRRLLAEGHALRVLVQPGDPAPGLAGLDVARWTGDLLEPGDWVEALAGCDAVVHAAGRVWLRNHGRELLRRINVEGLERLLQAASARRVRRFVLVSSAGVLGALPRPGACLDEEQTQSGPAVFAHHYHHSKWLAEKLFFEFPAGPLERIAVLPTMLWGPGDWNSISTGWALDALRGQPLFFPKTGGTNLVDAEEAARGVVAALAHGRPGERYLLAGENITFQVLCGTLAEAAGNGSRLHSLPVSLLYAMGGAAEALGLLGIPVNFSLDVARQCGNYWWVNGEKARRELGFASRWGAQETLRRTVAWYRDRTAAAAANR